MSDEPQPRVTRAPLTESEGCALLKARFEAAGYTIAEHVPFAEEGVEVVLDGFDAVRRVGYEFITTEAGDRAEFTAEVVDALEDRMARGELCLLLVDEAHVDAEALSRAADGFLSHLARAQDAS